MLLIESKVFFQCQLYCVKPFEYHINSKDITRLDFSLSLRYIWKVIDIKSPSHFKAKLIIIPVRPGTYFMDFTVILFSV